MGLFLQITTKKCYKLNTSILYTKMTNIDDIKKFLKRFNNDDTKTKVP